MAQTQEVWAKHPILYHYTTIEGLAGIVRTRQLWARYFRNLNDTTEFFHAKAKLKQLLVPPLKAEIKRRRREFKPIIRNSGGFDALAWHEAEALLDASFKSAFGSESKAPLFPPYVTSFCSHIDDKDGYVKKNGLLSMWRGYGAAGGVAVLFDTKALCDCLYAEQNQFAFTFLQFGDVVYAGDDLAFTSEFGPFVNSFKTKAVDMATKAKFDFDSEYLTGFFGLAARYKHRAFSEEREVRIVAIPMSQADKNRMPSSYEKRLKGIEERNQSQFIDLFGAQRLPIVGVIVGPNADQEGAFTNIKSIMSEYPRLDISKSETPFLPFRK